MTEDIQRLIGKIDANQDNIIRNLDELKRNYNKLSDEVRALDKKINYASGAAVVAIAVASFLSQKIATLLGLK